MHSSRMRTGRSLTVCCSLFGPGWGGSPWSRGVSVWSGGSPWSRGEGVCLVPGGWCLPGPGGLLGPGGVCLVQGGSPWSGGCLPGLGGSPWSQGVSVWSRGVLLGPRGGGVCLVPGGALRRPPLWTESQTRVKT